MAGLRAHTLGMKLIPLLGMLILAAPALADDEEAEEAPASSHSAEPAEAPGTSEISAGAASAAGATAQGGAGLGQSAKPEKKPSSGSVASGGGGSGTGSGAASGGGEASAFKGKFLIYDSLAAMPKHALAHGVMSFTPTVGYSVGFIPGPTGYCAAIDSPAAPAKSACKADMWISKKPGGPALPDCTQSGGLTTGGVWVPYSSPEHKDKFRPCLIKANTERHYCNIVVTRDWSNKDTYCGALLNSPLGRPDLEKK